MESDDAAGAAAGDEEPVESVVWADLFRLPTIPRSRRRISSTHSWRTRVSAPHELFSDRDQIQGFLDGSAFGHDFVLQKSDGVDELLWTGRASGNVDVHRDDLVDALHQRVVVEHSTGRRARSHRNPTIGE